MKIVHYLCLTSFLLVVFPKHTIAQQSNLSNPRTAFTKGSKQLTITYGYSRGEVFKNRSVTQIQTGYYIADRLMIGLTGSLMKEWLGEIHSNNLFSGGPLIRYHFTASRLSPFAALAYQLGKPVINPTINQSLSFTPGLNFSLLPAVRLEASYSLLLVPISEGIGQAQVGATILFGSKR